MTRHGRQTWWEEKRIQTSLESGALASSRVFRRGFYRWVVRARKVVDMAAAVGEFGRWEGPALRERGVPSGGVGVPKGGLKAQGAQLLRELRSLLVSRRRQLGTLSHQLRKGVAGWFSLFEDFRRTFGTYFDQI